jgi:hypothetical protein
MILVIPASLDSRQILASGDNAVSMTRHGRLAHRQIYVLEPAEIDYVPVGSSELLAAIT